MALTEKEKKELKREIQEKYRDRKHDKYPPGLTVGDIARDMRHSDKREISHVSNEMVEEK